MRMMAMVADAGQNIPEMRLPIEAVEIGGLDQGFDYGGAAAAGRVGDPRLSEPGASARTIIMTYQVTPVRERPRPRKAVPTGR